ncbi:MAG: ABC transporter ATP-binding protein [Victivallales bacterium]|jgi:ABC-type multidrug transport system fused ATPase/permease subunit
MKIKNYVDEGKNKVEANSFEIRKYGWQDVISRFLPLAKPHRNRLILSAACVSLVGLAVSVVPLFPKYIIDEAIPKKDLKLALVFAGLFIISQFLRMGLWFFAMSRIFRIQQSIIFELRSMSFGHLQKLCLRFHKKYPSGFLYERIFGNSINNLGAFMQTVFQQLTTQVAGLIFSLGFCLYLSPPLTCVILVGAIGYVIAARILSKRIYRKTQAANIAGMHVTEIIMDKLRGQKTIQAYAMEDRVQDEFERQLWPAQMKWLEGVLESMKLGFITEGLGYIITSVVVVGGAYAVMDLNQPLGVLVAFLGYQGILVGTIQSLTNVYGQFSSASAAFDQLFSVLDTNSSVVEKAGAKMPEKTEGALEFRNVSFGYTEKKTVLNNLSFTIPAGKTVALVGRSGCGKTTVSSLFMRFFDPVSGSVLLDGKDIRDLPLRQYRSLWGVVLQDPYLFDTSIAANMRYARPDASDAEIIENLKLARAWEFVKDCPDTINHRVGEAGGQLSGGQRQRLAIARCLMLKSKLVILDEATSALDPESDALVQESCNSLFTDKTVIVIAHRISTLKRADMIMVMDKGALVESGNYNELLAKNGLFRYLHDISNSGNGASGFKD